MEPVLASMLLLLLATCTSRQIMLGAEPVLLRGSFWTPAGLPQPKRHRRDFVVAGYRDFVSLCRIRMCLPSMPKSGIGVLKRLPGAFMTARVILFLMSHGGTAMRVRGDIVQFGGAPLVVEVA